MLFSENVSFLAFQVLSAFLNDLIFKVLVIEFAVSWAWMGHLEMFYIDLFKTHAGIITKCDYFIIALGAFLKLLEVVVTHPKTNKSGGSPVGGYEKSP